MSNKTDEQRLKEKLNRYKVLKVNEGNLEKTIALAKAQLNNQPISKSFGFIQQLSSQFRYISPAIWIVQVLMIIAIIIMLATIKGYVEATNQIDKVIEIMMMSIPIISFIGVSEVGKSYTYNMWETEMACKYSLGKLIAIKLIIIGLCDIFAVTIISSFASFYYQYSMIKIILYSLVPFNLMSFLYLLIINKIRSRMITYYCIGVAVFASITVKISFGFLQSVEAVPILFWIALLIVSSIMLSLEIYRILRNIERREVQETWN